MVATSYVNGRKHADVLASAWMDVLLATTRPSWPGHNTERLHEAISRKPPSMLKSFKLLPCCIPTQPTVLPQTFLSPIVCLIVPCGSVDGEDKDLRMLSRLLQYERHFPKKLWLAQSACNVQHKTRLAVMRQSFERRPFQLLH